MVFCIIWFGIFRTFTNTSTLFQSTRVAVFFFIPIVVASLLMRNTRYCASRQSMHIHNIRQIYLALWRARVRKNPFCIARQSAFTSLSSSYDRAIDIQIPTAILVLLCAGPYIVSHTRTHTLTQQPRLHSNVYRGRARSGFGPDDDCSPVFACTSTQETRGIKTT